MQLTGDAPEERIQKQGKGVNKDTLHYILVIFAILIVLFIVLLVLPLLGVSVWEMMASDSGDGGDSVLHGFSEVKPQSDTVFLNSFGSFDLTFTNEGGTAIELDKASLINKLTGDTCQLNFIEEPVPAGGSFRLSGAGCGAGDRGRYHVEL